MGDRMLRRTVVAGLGVVTVAVGAALIGPGRSATASTGPRLGELAPGTTLAGAGHRWTVIAVHPVTLGALPIVLEDQHGARYQIDVLARDPDGPPGIANTEHFSVYVSNRGDGASPTDESQGLGALAVGEALAAFERGGEPRPTLLSMRERSVQHPRGSFGVPLS